MKVQPPFLLRFIQEPGEIVFVPARWWHAVLNLEDVLVGDPAVGCYTSGKYYIKERK